MRLKFKRSGALLQCTAAFLPMPGFGERFAHQRHVMKSLFLSLPGCRFHNRPKSTEEK